MPIYVSLLLVAFFLAMNAFFVIAEFAMVRVRKSQIDLAVEEGKPGAAAAKVVVENVNAYLSACQLGITLASLALGWLGEPAFSELIRPVCSLVGLPDPVISAVAVALGYFIMTTLHVVVGELIPKSFAIFSTEKMALRTAGVLRVFYKITYPVMVMFNGITNAVVRLAGHDPAGEHEVYTGEEIQLLIDESTESGLIDAEQNEYVDNIFELNDKDASAIMTPRTDLVCLDLEDSLEENKALMRQYKYTRYPVCRGSKDNIVGFVHVKDLYSLPDDATMEDWNIRDIVAVPEGLSLPRLLQVMQERRSEITVVVDEHGGTAGIVTLSDVMEQIVGRIDDEYLHSAEEVVELSENRFKIDGMLPVGELEEVLGFEPEQASRCETAAGLLLILFDRIPKEGDEAALEHGGTKVTFRVLSMDRLRIDKIDVFIERAEEEPEEEE